MSYGVTAGINEAKSVLSKLPVRLTDVREDDGKELATVARDTWHFSEDREHADAGLSTYI